MNMTDEEYDAWLAKMESEAEGIEEEDEEEGDIDESFSGFLAKLISYGENTHTGERDFLPKMRAVYDEQWSDPLPWPLQSKDSDNRRSSWKGGE